MRRYRGEGYIFCKMLAYVTQNSANISCFIAFFLCNRSVLARNYREHKLESAPEKNSLFTARAPIIGYYFIKKKKIVKLEFNRWNSAYFTKSCVKACAVTNECVNLGVTFKLRVRG